MVSSESAGGWNIVTSTMVAVSLAVLVLVIGLIGRAPKISLYLMLPSFVMFINAIFANNKILENISDKNHMQKWDDFATVCFDAGMTFLISAFAVLSYKVVDIVSAVIFLAFVWGAAIVHKNAKHFWHAEKLSVFRALSTFTAEKPRNIF